MSPYRHSLFEYIIYAMHYSYIAIIDQNNLNLNACSHVGVVYKYNYMNYYFQVSSNKMADESRT